MAPEAWGGVSLIISLNKKAGLEEIVGKNPGLGKAIIALANLKVDLLIMIVTLKLYSSMNSSRMSAILMRTYSGSGIGVLR